MIWQLPMQKGFAYLAFQTENNGLVPMDRIKPGGYIAQEIQKLVGTRSTRVPNKQS